MVADTFDSRWKNPSGATNQELYLWAQSLIKELRGGGFVNALGLMDTEGAQDAVGGILSNAGDIVFTYDDATPAITAAIKNDAVTTAKILNDAVTTGKILNDAVTYAKIQNVSVTDRLLGRDTAGAGDIEELTLSQALDFIGSAAQGDILYRGAANWARLGAGTSGQFLQTLGAAANPQWALPGLVLLTSGTVNNAASLDIVLTAYTGFRAIKFVLSAFVPATDDVELWMRFSTNGGSSYDATGYSFANSGWRDGADGDLLARSAAANQIIVAGSTAATLAVSNVAAEGGADAEVVLHNQTNTGRWSRARISSVAMSAVQETIAQHGGGMREAAQDTDAVQFLFESGNIASGSYAVYGLA